MQFCENAETRFFKKPILRKHRNVFLQKMQLCRKKGDKYPAFYNKEERGYCQPCI